MDPSRSGSYQDDGDGDVAGAPATGRPEIDLNNPAQQEEGSQVHSPAVDAPVQQAPALHDYSGSNNGSGNSYGSGNYGSGNHGRSSGDGYVDWARGSIDVGPDGKLSFSENAHPATEPVRSHGDTGFDLNAAVREAQERDEAYCQERLENLRKGKALEDQFLQDASFRNSSSAEDPGYFKLWND